MRRIWNGVKTCVLNHPPASRSSKSRVSEGDSASIGTTETSVFIGTFLAVVLSTYSPVVGNLTWLAAYLESATGITILSGINRFPSSIPTALSRALLVTAGVGLLPELAVIAGKKYTTGFPLNGTVRDVKVKPEAIGLSVGFVVIFVLQVIQVAEGAQQVLIILYPIYVVAAGNALRNLERDNLLWSAAIYWFVIFAGIFGIGVIFKLRAAILEATQTGSTDIVIATTTVLIPYTLWAVTRAVSEYESPTAYPVYVFCSVLTIEAIITSSLVIFFYII